MPSTPRMSWVFPSENQEPFFDAIEDFFGQQDASGYAAREDRHIILRGGEVSFVADPGLITWNADFELFAPITGFKWVIPASYAQLADGELLYVNLVRAPSSNLSLTMQKASQVPNTDSAHIIAIRSGARVYFFNGSSVAEGEPLIDAGAGGGGGGGATPTLQEAYEAGIGEIFLTDANGPIIINDIFATASTSALVVQQTVTTGFGIASANTQPGVGNSAAYFQGKTYYEGPAAADLALGFGIHNMAPMDTITEGTCTFHVVQWVQDLFGWGSNYWFFMADSAPDGQVTSGDVGAFCFDAGTGDWYRKTAAPSTWEAVGGGGGLSPVHFTVNGPLSGLTVPTDYVDGLREVGLACEVSAVILTQEIDGGANLIDVEVYKIDQFGVETQITTPGTFQMFAGIGDRQRIASTNFIGTNYQLAATDRLGIKITAVQTAPCADLTVTVLLAGAVAAPPPGLPEDDEVTQALFHTVLGTTFENVGTVYLPAGTILAADSRVFMGVDNGIDNAELEIRNAVTSALITTITANGLPADTQPGGNINIPTDAWYSLRLRSDNVAATATLFGIKLVYALGTGTRIRQGMDAQVTGTTFENVGAVYLPAGTLQGGSQLFAGATTAGPNAAEIELRRQTGGTLIKTWTAIGQLQAVADGPVTIPASDWYNIRLRGNAGGVVALLKGLDWTVLT